MVIYFVMMIKMTVKELIEKLQEFDEDAFVEIYTNDDYTNDVKTVFMSVLSGYYETVIIQNF